MIDKMDKLSKFVYNTTLFTRACDLNLTFRLDVMDKRAVAPSWDA